MPADPHNGQLGRTHQFHGVQPVLPVADVAASAEFFDRVLGFEIDFVEGEPAVHARVKVVGAALGVAGEGPAEAGSLDRCRGLLSGYKRPHALLLVREEQVPMTGSGKVQKVVLRDRLLGETKARGAKIVRWT